VSPNGFDQFGQGISILRLTVLPAVHAIVEMDDIELRLIQNQLYFLEQYRVGDKAGRRKTGHEGFPGELLFHFRIVFPRNGIADEQDARMIGFIRMRNPDVAPFDGFTGRRQCVLFSASQVACKYSSAEEKRQTVLHKKLAMKNHYCVRRM